VLAVSYQDATIDQVLDMTVEQAAEFFTEPPLLATVLDALVRVGLGYLALGQSATELSGGEAQRLKLANALVRGAKGGRRGLVLLDEPVTGLHPADVERLVACLDALLDKKNTVVVAEHDLHLAAVADWIVDMGPGAGADGGKVINQGTVAEVVDGPGPTMSYLRKLAST
jgi:excinuclease ABC subunit A